jgi:HEAT repeat protein
MRYVRGFDTQILEALKSENEEIHYEAVCAAGTWGVDGAWSHIASLATSELTDKWLRLAAIEALASIRPQEAADILTELTLSDDEDIVEMAYEAMAMYDLLPDEDYDDDDGDWDERIK